jgi:MFS family permease
VGTAGPANQTPGHAAASEPVVSAAPATEATATGPEAKAATTTVPGQPPGGPPGPARRPSVLRHQGFLLLFTGETISLLGSEVTTIALPLLAVLTFGGGALTVGALAALQWVPYVLLGPVAGVFTDRVRRRPLMIFASAARAAVLGALPITAAFGHLSITLLYVAAVLKGVLDVVFQLAYQAHLPSLLPREDLMDANAKTQMSRSLATVFGRSIGGVLVQGLGAARAIGADAASYVVSAVTVAFIRTPEPPPRPRAAGVRAVIAEIGLGLTAVFGNRLLRGLTMMGFFANAAVSLTLTMLIVFATRTLGFSPGTLGFALASGGVGFVIGAVFSRRIVARVGMGRTLVYTHLVLGAALLLLPFAPHGAAGVVIVVASQFLASLTTPVANVGILTMVQHATPVHLMGRVGGVSLPLVWGANALGPLLGAVIAESLGYRACFILAGALAWCAIAWIVAGGVYRVRSEVPAEQRVAG